ncbi:MAG: OmcA/MtrC family decaheme c-type cytochrome, partial [Syntrophales bacterium]
TGPTGPAGPIVTNIATQSAAALAAATFSGSVTGVTIASPPVVDFWIKDAAGNGVTGLGAPSGANLNYLRFAIAKLVPGTDGSPDKWVSYMVTDTSRPSSERVAANLVDNGNGYYRYTFAKNITDPTQTGGVTYEPSRTHRLVIQFSGTVPGTTNAIANPLNIIHDFVPAGGALPLQREITTTAACNSCHGAIGTSTPHGGRIDTRHCVVCHTDQRAIGRTEAATDANGNFTARASGTYLVDGRAVGNFTNMIHKTHMGNLLSKKNYNYGRVFFDTMGFSMLDEGIRNCRKCHTESANAAQGDNWKNKPSRIACGACHDNVNFATGQNHGIGGARDNDSACAACHPANEIERYHLTANATTNNPNVPTGLVNFTYAISDVAVNGSNQAVIKFTIKKDGTAVTFDGAGSTASSPPAGALLTGFSGSPSFLLAYADGTDTKVDFNNKGVAAAQPLSVSIAYLKAVGNTRGTITGPVDGVYTATVTAAAYNFPVGAKMRTVALQGY